MRGGGSVGAGQSIRCRPISVRLRIFAGLCPWRLPTEAEQEIVCQEIVSGAVAHGTVRLIAPETETKERP